MAKEKDYSSYQAEDLLADESFQNWVLHPEASHLSTQFWEAALAEDTPLAAHISIARDLITGIRFKEDFPDDAVIKASLEKNLSQIHVVESAADAPLKKITVSQRKNFSLLTRAAAVLAGLLIGTYLIIQYVQTKQTIRVETAYGETRTIILPDSSEIILNAHSAITYPKHWAKHKTRSLTLEGEAYFNIRHLNQDRDHIKPGERFIVHSGPVDIEILGTRFDARHTGDAANIVLEKGSIQLTAKSTGQRLAMQPGDRVVYKEKSKQFNRTRVQPSDYINWTNHELVLKGENLRQIARMLSAYYGVQVQFRGDDIAEKKMEGTILLDSMPDVIFALSTAMDLSIEQDGNTLIFQKRKK